LSYKLQARTEQTSRWHRQLTDCNA